MDPYNPPISKLLQTPEPHYLPGYTGYCPQLKYNMGKPYAMVTAELLTNPEVKHSNRLVLQPNRVPDSPSHNGTLPDINLRMIPGFTGFIPKHQNYFASRYSDMCRKALSEFHQERDARLSSAILPSGCRSTKDQSELSTQGPKLPLAATSKEVFEYKPVTPVIPSVRPYRMADDNPYKYFMSGFTGHVPQSRFLIGQSYPVLTNRALIRFGQQQQGDSTSRDVSSGQDGANTLLMRQNRGLVPSFTGHIPGYRYTWGGTYGHLAPEAIEKFRSKRMQQDRA